MEKKGGEGMKKEEDEKEQRETRTQNTRRIETKVESKERKEKLFKLGFSILTAAEKEREEEVMKIEEEWKTRT